MTISNVTWELPAHTEAKHRVVAEYLKAWFPIISTNEKKVAFIDGFAGPGRYDGGQPGSPLVAIETLVDHTALPKMSNCTFLFKFIEADPERAERLERNLDEFETVRGGLPKNVLWSVENRPFIESVREFLDGLEKNHRLIPAVALVDPFGFSGVPMAEIAELLRWPKCELIFNFMFDPINRWATAGNVDHHLTELFGCDEYKNAPTSGQARKDFLRDLYARQLHDVGRFEYVRAFEMVTKRHRTGNYLFFGTRHDSGLKAMKRAMWKVDPERGTRFAISDRDPAQPTFEFAEGPDLRPLRAVLEAEFSGRTVTIGEVERFVRVKTDFLEDSHLKRKTLLPMQKAGLITDPEGKPRKGQFPAGSILRFV